MYSLERKIELIEQDITNLDKKIKELDTRKDELSVLLWGYQEDLQNLLLKEN